MSSFDLLAAIEQVIKMVPAVDDAGSIWTFPWDEKISLLTTTGLYAPFFLRDVVNTHEFRGRLSQMLSNSDWEAEVHPLEHDAEINSEGVVICSDAYLNLSFKPTSCDECGKAVKNGRLTCLCWADQDDLNKMDIMISRGY